MLALVFVRHEVQNLRLTDGVMQLKSKFYKILMNTPNHV